MIDKQETSVATATANYVVALVGNPNTGKTTLFNALSGLRHHVGNYAGVTVEVKKGHFHHANANVELLDLPGTYSLAPRSPDEMVAVDVLMGRQKEEPAPDVILCIVDASNLQRNLYLTTQAMEIGAPVVVALNMMDVARSERIEIDVEKLSGQLGVPVVPIQANRGVGLEALKETLLKTAEEHARTDAALSERSPFRVPFPEAFEQEVESLRVSTGPDVPEFLVRRLLIDVEGSTEHVLIQNSDGSLQEKVQIARQRLVDAECPVPAVEARSRYNWIRGITADCVQRPEIRAKSWTDRLDAILTNRFSGTLILAVVMFILFQSIFTAAGPLMDLIGDGQTFLGDSLRSVLPGGPLASLLVDGVIGGVGAVLVFLPQIFILFAFIAILEDCGYMARAAFLMDRVMAGCGLSGRSFIPLLSSVACAIPGIMATRGIEQRRDRIATILVAPLMSCSARLPVYVLLIGAFLTTGYAWWVPGLVMFCLYALGIILAPLVAFVVKRTVLRGETPVFLMEMPPYRWPSIRLVGRRMWDSGMAFIKRAGTFIFASMIVVWAVLYFPHKDANGVSYEKQLVAIEESIEEKTAELEKQQKLPASPEQAATVKELEADIEQQEQRAGQLQGKWKRQSYLGRVGQAIEPAVKPLGWDWRIGVAALASFPAREVLVGTLGIVYQLGEVDPGEIEESENVSETPLGTALRQATWDDDPSRKVFTVPVALSVLVFVALCCQCASTLAVIRRETRSWRWPIITFTYMTLLAYVGALITTRVGNLFI